MSKHYEDIIISSTEYIYSRPSHTLLKIGCFVTPYLGCLDTPGVLYLLLHLSGVLSHLCECNKVYYTLRVFGNLFSDRSYTILVRYP